MLFNSLVFFTLLIPVLFGYWLAPWRKVRLLILLVASFAFYGYYHWPSIFLLIFTISFNYFMGKKMQLKPTKVRLGVLIATNLSILIWFKYSRFLANNINTLCSLLGASITIPEPPAFLPLGISFFTFQVIAYQIDIYRQEIRAEDSMLNFAVFKCFFPQLIAGPIVRAKDFLPQLRCLVKFNSNDFHQGLWLIIVGLALKTALADVLAQFANDAFSAPEKLTTTGAWMGVYAYAFQLYADFWAYSTIAVGLAALFGLRLPLNFDTPYAAISIQEF